jgi:hypothetical protein
VYTKCYKLGDGLLCGYTRKMLDYTDLTSAQRSNIPSGQTSCRPMHSIWTLDIGRETIGNKTLQRRANVEPISRANVDLMSKMTTGQRWNSTLNQRQRRPLTDVGPTSLCRLGTDTTMLMVGFCSCVRCRNRLSVVCDCIDRFRYFVIVLIKY